MKCRHCSTAFHDQWAQLGSTLSDKDGTFYVFSTTCPECNRLMLAYERAGPLRVFLYPRSISREPLDASVPSAYAEDYAEACEVLDISPKASAALSRRCLQHILRECAKVTHGNLSNEIQQLLDAKALPSYIADSLDAVRMVGNFAAHPIKSTTSGEIVPVEAGEAEWNLNTVEALLDFYFAQPAKLAAKRQTLDKKLVDAGKPPLK
jgi:Domain of unknown function (DUF4145)